ncbi:I78 family peptidase inhibitor [Celeribacter neptunius]|uniref:Peptidase inhibitor I78 family protein n=1 Tax=Celeribacter neptunius TaxID=588602 RepID=A0A1I3WV74_9RHOB|nr:I78 family peptidase inhibitor [Celeribacter neptunius]SFK11524.1 Peptidase inhibitor I78 family protein [Celeribacter neptunius]
MKRLMILPLLTLMACQDETVTAETTDPVQPAPAEQSCALDLVSPLVGELQEALETVDIPDPVRVLLPGMMMTEDFRPDRTNIDIGEDGRIARVWCG